MSVTETADSYAVSIEEALDEMYSTMDFLYGPATRASRPAIATIETFKREHLGGQTRSKITLPENIYYIVNFENEGGFAVMGADQRILPLICITEAGSMTLEDLLQVEKASTRSGDPTELTLEQLWCPYSEMEGYEYDPEDDNDESGEYLISLAYDSEKAIVSEMITHPVFIPEEGSGNIYKEYTDWAVKTKKGPFLTTKWHQDAPFDLQKSERPAGCVPIAIAQIIAYNEKPSTSYFNVTSSWKELKSYGTIDYYNLNPESRRCIQNDLAKIVRTMALGMNAHYNYMRSGQTFVWPVKAKKYMKKSLGYSAKKRNGYKGSVITSMINAGKPVFIGALDKKVTNGGHAWVMDGILSQSHTVKTYGGTPLVFKGTTTESRSFIHCNFGWGGKCDGYYVSECFDLNRGAKEVEVGVDVNKQGDSTGTTDSNFTWWYRIIEY